MNVSSVHLGTLKVVCQKKLSTEAVMSSLLVEDLCQCIDGLVGGKPSDGSPLNRLS